jgi:NADPH:quinone reductase-like Zn-dependent oxidoreductase
VTADVTGSRASAAHGNGHGATIRAIVRHGFGSPDDVVHLRLVDPPVPGEGEVLVRVRAAGVGIGDWLEVRGYPYFARPGYGRPRDVVAGNELAGVVEAVGPGIRSLRVGEEVFGSARGTFAELVAADEATIAPKPSNLTFEQAAGVPISGVAALQALRDAGRVDAGQRVAILGASGGVGTYAVQLAKALGAEVTGVCGTSSVELVRSLGADHVVDYRKEDLADHERAYDLVVDTVGKQRLNDLRRAMTPKGTLVLVGGSGGPWTMGFERTIAGAALSPLVRQRIRPFFSKVTRRDLVFLKDLIEAGEVTPVVDRRFPLGFVRDALDHVGRRHTRGRTILTV